MFTMAATTDVASSTEWQPTMKAMCLPVRVGHRRLDAIVDTGAGHSLCQPALLDNPLLATSAWQTQLGTANGSPLSVRGKATLSVLVGRQLFAIPVLIAPNLCCPLLLGNDFLRLSDAKLDFDTQTLRTGSETHSFSVDRLLPSAILVADMPTVDEPDIPDVVPTTITVQDIVTKLETVSDSHELRFVTVMPYIWVGDSSDSSGDILRGELHVAAGGDLHVAPSGIYTWQDRILPSSI